MIWGPLKFENQLTDQILNIFISNLLGLLFSIFGNDKDFYVNFSGKMFWTNYSQNE